MKSHPKRMEMKKKKIPPGPEASKEAFGDAQMGFSDAALSKFSQDDFFFYIFLYFGFWIPQRNAERTLPDHPIWIKTV